MFPIFRILWLGLAYILTTDYTEGEQADPLIITNLKPPDNRVRHREVRTLKPPFFGFGMETA